MMAEQQEMADEDLVMLPATFDFETTLAGDSSDDDFQSIPEADMGVLPEPKITSDVILEAAAEALPLSDHISVDGKDEKIKSKEAVGNKPGGRLEVIIQPLPVHLRTEYVPIKPGFEVYRVLGPISSSVPGESWWTVEYEDGKIDQVAFDDLLDLPNGRKALNLWERGDDYDDDMNPGKKRKSRGDSDYEMDMGSADDDEAMPDFDEDADDDVISSKRRQPYRHASSSVARRSTRNSARPPSTHRHGQPSLGSHSAANGRTLRTRKPVPVHNGKLMSQDDDDVDELAQSDGSETFEMVRSDLQPAKRNKRRKRSGRATFASATDRGSSVEYEPVRRSGRATKTTKNMKDPLVDEELYAEDDKVAAAPKVISIKEVFQPLDDGDFKHVHSKQCETCGLPSLVAGKGPLIPCQGCSFAYHKMCLGYRSARDHYVTKVGPEYFVLQCRYCTLHHKKTDPNSPNRNSCMTCKAPGPACEPFAPKKSAKQEEKERNANNGIDPIHQVAPDLINEANNVLFRCSKCKCAFHYEHLPPFKTEKGGVVSDNIRAERLTEYSIEWKCKDCLDMSENTVGVLVAWRPKDQASYRPGQTYHDIAEDDKEYLIKFEDQSYFHCVWKPGPWVWGVTKPIMRGAFAKRNDGDNLLPKWDEKAAIPEEYLLADVILSVKYRENGKIHATTKEDEFKNITKIRAVRLKFQGLAYEDVVWDSPPPRDSGIIWKAFEAAFYEYLNGKYFKTEPSYKIKERINNFRSVKHYEEDISLKRHPEAIKDLVRGDLMDYQIAGVNWLLHSFYCGVSAVLADEMGLGKTVQVIALLTFLVERDPKCWPFLIVVPNSTCPNWRRELKKWAPDLRVVTYHGGKNPQQLAYDYELFPGGSKDMRAHVVVMSYDSAQDPGTKVLFKGVSWAGLVVDEGQRLKNDQNLLYLALRAMKIPFRLLLTGTPLQNNKRELFNLLQFIDSSKNAEALDEEYKEITPENLPILHKMLRPYFLRRTKKEVLHFLPPIAQIIVPVSMSVVQERLCKSIMAKNPDLIRAIFAHSKMKATERGSLNNILMQLRKCLCHPFMYSGLIEDKSADPEVMFRNLIEASSKLVLLEIMLPKLKERGHRVLIFSQFLDQLDIIEDFLSGLKYDYRRLDGNISSLEKQKRIDAYNEPGSDIFAFLLSTRAGGVGINLATADTVIILDPDFNPHQDIQALSRAHRIGQKEKVLCFQLMTKDSVEEKIMQIGRKKMALDHLLIETMDDQEDVGNDLESILKHGAEALFSENEKDSIKYDSASVDKLLDRSQMEATQTGPDDSAESQFSLARVWANEKGALADDIEAGAETEGLNPSTWEAILKEREELARREAELNKETLGRGGRRRRAVQYTGPNYGLDDAAATRGEDEGSDADDDFVNNGVASDGENSDEGSDVSPEELQAAAAAEVGNSRKSQGKAAKKGTAPQKAPEVSAQGTEATKSKSKTINTKSQPKPKSRSAGTPSKPKARKPSSPPEDRKSSLPTAPLPKSQSGSQPETPMFKSSAADRRRDNMQSPVPAAMQQHYPTGAYLTNGIGFPNNVSHQNWQQQPSGRASYLAPYSSPYIRNNIPAPGNGGQPAHSANIATEPTNGSVIAPTLPTCEKCCTRHTSLECPQIDLNSEINLRIALDSLRVPPNGDRSQYEAKKRVLTAKLRNMVKRSYENGGDDFGSN